MVERRSFGTELGRHKPISLARCTRAARTAISASPERQSFGLAHLPVMDNHGPQVAHIQRHAGCRQIACAGSHQRENEMIRKKGLSATAFSIGLSVALALVSLPAAAKDKVKVAFIGP